MKVLRIKVTWKLGETPLTLPRGSPDNTTSVEVMNSSIYTLMKPSNVRRVQSFNCKISCGQLKFDPQTLTMSH